MPAARRNLVLGGGIAGLGAAYEARRLGLDATIYEARETPGGLLENFTIHGFRFDQAVHLSFATEPEVRAVFDPTIHFKHKPESLCWDTGLWLKHPVQTNLYPLPAEEKVELIAGLVEVETGPIDHYEDWLVQQYGAPIAKRWPLPYTEKYWTVPAAELGTEWVGQRMRRADLREVLRGAVSPDTANHYYAKEMRYPEQGGYRSFLDPLVETADIRSGKRVVRIDVQARRVLFADHSEAAYDALVSTIPLPIVVGMISDCPERIRQLASTLFATSVDLISVGFNRPDVAPALWFYIYDRDIAAARAYSPDLKSPANVPPGCSALQFEIYSSTRAPQRLSPAEQKENTVRGIEKMGLATAQDIVVLDHRRLPFGNVVFDRGMEDRRDEVRAWVESQGVHCAGRFGEWKYLWSNQAMLSGIAAARLAFG
ncbi:MAG TPA: NAD(P)-binding protein [Sphingomonas sp.]|jgi:protoporphyrinogen oxidase|uniref:protoporphyrinogen/coproporphyrinogen oxidase n=1 Tax=Sphingomonas sp. TaxID=28214 RepID=UPI002EDAAADD